MILIMFLKYLSMDKKKRNCVVCFEFYENNWDPPKRKQENIEIFSKILPYNWLPGLINQNFIMIRYSTLSFIWYFPGAETFFWERWHKTFSDPKDPFFPWWKYFCPPLKRNLHRWKNPRHASGWNKVWSPCQKEPNHIKWEG